MFSITESHHFLSCTGKENFLSKNIQLFHEWKLFRLLVARMGLASIDLHRYSSLPCVQKNSWVKSWSPNDRNPVNSWRQSFIRSNNVLDAHAFRSQSSRSRPRSEKHPTENFAFQVIQWDFLGNGHFQILLTTNHLRDQFWNLNDLYVKKLIRCVCAFLSTLPKKRLVIHQENEQECYA